MEFLLSVSEDIAQVTDWLTANWAIVLAWIGIPLGGTGIIFKVASIINNIIGLKKAKTLAGAIEEVKGTVKQEISELGNELKVSVEEVGKAYNLAQETALKAKKEILGIVENTKTEATEIISEVKENVEAVKEAVAEVVADVKENADNVVKVVKRVVKRG